MVMIVAGGGGKRGVNGDVDDVRSVLGPGHDLGGRLQHRPDHCGGGGDAVAASEIPEPVGQACLGHGGEARLGVAIQ